MTCQDYKITSLFDLENINNFCSLKLCINYFMISYEYLDLNWKNCINGGEFVSCDLQYVINNVVNKNFKMIYIICDDYDIIKKILINNYEKIKIESNINVAQINKLYKVLFYNYDIREIIILNKGGRVNKNFRFDNIIKKNNSFLMIKDLWKNNNFMNYDINYVYNI